MSTAMKQAEPSDSPVTTASAWLLQIRKGELRIINDLGELVRLVLERRVERHALLYQISGQPCVLAEVPELAQLFEGGKSGGSSTLAGSDAVALEHTFESEEVPYLDAISPLGSTEQAFGEDYYLPPRRSGSKVLVTLLVLGLLGAGGYLAFERPRSVPSVTAPAPTPAPLPPVTAPPVRPPGPVMVEAVSRAEEPKPPEEAKAIEAPVPAPKEPEAPPPPAPVATVKELEKAPAPVPVAAKEPTKKPEKARPAAPARGYDDLVRQGDRLIEAGKTKRAMELFEQASRLRPDGAAALGGLAYGWLDRGDTRRAVSLFQRAIDADAGFAPALFGLGEAYREAGRREEALVAFRRYLTRFPANKEANAARRQVEQLNAPGAR